MSWIRSFLVAFCLTLQSIGVQSHASSLNSRNAVDVSSGVTDLSVSDILEKAMQAMGGKHALKNMKTVSSHALIHRTFSLAESYTPGLSNTAISSKGQQTVSYDLHDPSTVVQRIDTKSVLGDYWTFYRPDLMGVDASLVLRSGPNGYACFNKGNTLLFAPYDAPAGYIDAAYAHILVRDAWRLSPGLLLAMEASASTLTAFDVTVNNVVSNPALHDSSTNLTIIFDPATFLPSRIRAYEDHHILGPSNSDIILYNYTATEGIKFARNIKLLYNGNIMLQEILYDSIKVNPKLSGDFFSPLPASVVNQTLFALPPSAPQASDEYGAAEVFEYSQNMFWAGGYTGTLPALKVVKPIPGLDNLYHLTFEDNNVYRTILAIFDDAVMVTDAPPHQSKLVLQYVQQKFNRTVTHLLVTHHHHDHNLGASDYVAQGAKMVVPETFTYYWQKIPNVQFETANEAQPFMYKDSKMQVRGVWHQVNAHSADWMYFTFTETCPDADSPMGVVTADGWSPGYHPWDYGQQSVVEWLGIARADRVPKANMALPIHGDPTNSSVLYPQIGYEYPDYTTADFLPGGPWC